MEIVELKRLAKQKHLTYLQISKLSGVPLQTIRKIFAGQTKHPRIDTMQAIETAITTKENNVSDSLQIDIERLNNLKKDKGLTFDEIAELSNVPKRTIEDIFSGRTPHPRIDTILKIEEALQTVQISKNIMSGEIKEIKDKMRVNGITQLQLSEMTGVPIQTIKYIFTGRTLHPRIDTMQAIEKALGIADGETLTDKERRLLKAFNILLEPMQDIMLEQIEKLAGTHSDYTQEQVKDTNSYEDLGKLVADLIIEQLINKKGTEKQDEENDLDKKGISVTSRPRKDGRYQGYYLDGENKKYIYGKTKAEVEDKIRQLLRVQK